MSEWQQIGTLTTKQSRSQSVIPCDWLLVQMHELRRKNPGVKVTLDQLYSERIPCDKRMEKLISTNAELFYTVREYGTRAADLMRAYGL